MKVIIDCGGDKIAMDRDGLPEIGTYVWSADSRFAFRVTSVEWSESVSAFEVSTERVNKETGDVE